MLFQIRTWRKITIDVLPQYLLYVALAVRAVSLNRVYGGTLNMFNNSNKPDNGRNRTEAGSDENEI